LGVVFAQHFSYACKTVAVLVVKQNKTAKATFLTCFGIVSFSLAYSFVFVGATNTTRNKTEQNPVVYSSDIARSINLFIYLLT